MTIKKQFFSLASLIILIPLLCGIFIFLHYFIHSSERVLIKEYKEAKKNIELPFTEQDWQNIYNQIKSLPPDVEAAIITNDYTIVMSSIPGLSSSEPFSELQLFSLLNRTSKTYYYQYTSLNELKGFILTRVPKNKKDRKKSEGVIIPLIIFLFSLVLIAALFLFKIFTNITKSIEVLEKQTQEIANGDLSVKVTKKNRNSNEIVSITNSLERMRLSLLEAQNQKNKFIMGMSHDLRTPVAIIKGYMEALSDGVITETDEIHNTYNLISLKTTQLEDMINTLINFMKINSTEFREQLLPESISDLVSTFIKDAEATGLILKRKVTTRNLLDKDTKIPLNKQLVTRVFENLLSNALRYTKENDEINICAEQNEKSIIIKISDTGCGIAEEDLDNIFELFYRGTNSRREEGIGIGLSVVKNIVDTHGWSINVSSKLNEGSCFTITIPLETQN